MDLSASGSSTNDIINAAARFLSGKTGDTQAWPGTSAPGASRAVSTDFYTHVYFNRIIVSNLNMPATKSRGDSSLSWIPDGYPRCQLRGPRCHSEKHQQGRRVQRKYSRRHRRLEAFQSYHRRQSLFYCRKPIPWPQTHIRILQARAILCHCARRCIYCVGG